MVVCDNCGDKFHEECVEFDPRLPFYYCNNCVVDMNDSDPATNMALLKYLAGCSVKDMTNEFGTDIFDRILQSNITYELVNNKLFRNKQGIWKQVPAPIDRFDICKQLHEVMGHCGIRKLCNIVRQYYFFPDIY